MNNRLTNRESENSNISIDFIKNIVVATVFSLIIISNIGFGARIKGASMNPNIRENELLLVNSIGVSLETLDYGDIVCIKFSEIWELRNSKENIIKRVIGLPGDKVQIQSGKVIVNNRELDETYLPSSTKTYLKFADGAYWELKDDQVFVMGDNREFSYDSRDFGPVKIDDIIGKAFWRVLPISKVGII